MRSRLAIQSSLHPHKVGGGLPTSDEVGMKKAKQAARPCRLEHHRPTSHGVGMMKRRRVAMLICWSDRPFPSISPTSQYQVLFQACDYYGR